MIDEALALKFRKIQKVELITAASERLNQGATIIIMIH